VGVTPCKKAAKERRQSPERLRAERASRMLDEPVDGTEFERLDGYHALRHAFISVLLAQGKTWDQIAAFVGHLDPKTTRRYIHFMPKDTTRRLLAMCARLERGSDFRRALAVCVLNKVPPEDRKVIGETFDHHVGGKG